MSITASMQKAILQERIKVNTPSNAIKYDWENVCDISISIFPNTDKSGSYTRLSAGSQINFSSHVGITNYSKINKNNNRVIAADGSIYTIDNISKGRKTLLYLKEVKENGGV